jgi:hypothetical protein
MARAAHQTSDGCGELIVHVGDDGNLVTIGASVQAMKPACSR